MMRSDGNIGKPFKASRKDLEVRHNMACVLFQSLEVLAVFTSAEAL